MDYRARATSGTAGVAFGVPLRSQVAQGLTAKCTEVWRESGAMLLRPPFFVGAVGWKQPWWESELGHCPGGWRGKGPVGADTALSPDMNLSCEHIPRDPEFYFR